MITIKQTVNDNTRYFYAALLITLGFFLVYLVQTELANWQLVLCISVGYGGSIYSCIWFTWFLAEIGLKEKITRLTFWQSVGISFLGLVPGSLLGSILRAKFLKLEAVDLTGVPQVILVGVFITLLFHFWGKSLIQDKENNELKSINEKLQAKRKKVYIEQVSSKIGKQSKVLNVKDIEYFVSESHCTLAIIQNQEYFIDSSLKKLAEELNPQDFLQVHRNSIIRIDQIKSIKNGSNWVLETHAGKELSISRNNRKKIKDALLL